MRGFFFAVGLCVGLSGVAAAQSLPLPAGQQAVLKADGRGFQIYKCGMRDQVPAWVFVGPEAKLLVEGAEVGSHGAGPAWKYKDGSMVRGKMVQSLASPLTDAIPWLLVKADGTTGKGLMNSVTYIRRTDTSGGQAKAADCDIDHQGTISRVAYTAIYTFYAAAASAAK